MTPQAIKLSEIQDFKYTFDKVITSPKKQYTIAETFVGAGGSHLGFKNNNFRTVYVNEFDSNCIETLKHNNPEIFDNAIVDHKDINDVDFDFISSALKNSVDVLFGGIVCKGFSLAGEKSPIDERNYLYEKQLRLVEAINPRVSVIENVPGLLNAKIVKHNICQDLKEQINEVWKELENIKGIKAKKRKANLNTEKEEIKSKELRKRKKEILFHLEENNLFINVVEDIIKKYNDLGYRVDYRILNSSWYGSYTARDRLVIVAVRNDIEKEYIFPKITHFKKDIKVKNVIPIDTKYKKLNTVGKALSLINYNQDDDIDNLPMQHTDKTKRRFSYIPEGGNIQDVIDTLPEELKISKFYSRGCTMRLSRNKPSPTLVPGHSNFPVHPIEDRSITVREAATITGFPLDYKFFGSHSSRCEQVGNAVPVHLSNAIAKSVKEFLDNL